MTPADRGHNPGEPKTIAAGQHRNGSNGFLTARMPQAFAARSSGRNNMRKHVRVLVAVNMCQRNSPRLDLANLRFHFPLNFIRGNLLANCGQGELFQAAAEPLRRFCKCWKVTRERNAIDQHDVASCLEAGLRLGQIDRGVAGFCVGHERSRRDNARSIALDDRAVYARGQAKIICINNEATHWVSLTKRACLTSDLQNPFLSG